MHVSGFRFVLLIVLIICASVDVRFYYVRLSFPVSQKYVVAFMACESLIKNKYQLSLTNPRDALTANVL